jgi:hypothetical protein
MAAIFLLLAILGGVLLGAAVLVNTSASSLSVFSYSLTGFTQGQLLLTAAGLGLLVALLLGLAWSSSSGRRGKRRARRAAQRELEGRVAEGERENARLRAELARMGRLAGLLAEPVGAPALRTTQERAPQPRVEAHA